MTIKDLCTKHFQNIPKLKNLVYISLWVPTSAKILVCEVIIGHNVWKGGFEIQDSIFWGRLRAPVTSLWRLFRGKKFLRRLGKPVTSIQTAIELRTNTLEIIFSIKNVGKDLTIAIMIKKGEWNEAILKDFNFFAVQAIFLAVNSHQPHQSCRTCVFECLTTVLLNWGMVHHRVNENFTRMNDRRAVNEGWMKFLFLIFFIFW